MSALPDARAIRREIGNLFRLLYRLERGAVLTINAGLSVTVISEKIDGAVARFGFDEPLDKLPACCVDRIARQRKALCDPGHRLQQTRQIAGASDKCGIGREVSAEAVINPQNLGAATVGFEDKRGSDRLRVSELDPLDNKRDHDSCPSVGCLAAPMVEASGGAVVMALPLAVPA